MVQIVNIMRVKCKMLKDLPWDVFFFFKAVVYLYPNPIFINNSMIFCYISSLIFYTLAGSFLKGPAHLIDSIMSVSYLNYIFWLKGQDGGEGPLQSYINRAGEAVRHAISPLLQNQGKNENLSPPRRGRRYISRLGSTRSVQSL